MPPDPPCHYKNVTSFLTDIQEFLDPPLNADKKREKPCVLTSETQIMFANAFKNKNFRFRLNV